MNYELSFLWYGYLYFHSSYAKFIYCLYKLLLNFKQFFCIKYKKALTHVKIRDLLYRATIDFIGTVHFFNPVIFFIKRQTNIFWELSCDEIVAQNMDIQQRKDYGKTILNLMKHNNIRLQSSVFFSENEKTIKRKLIDIMKDQEISKLTVGFSLILTLALTIFSVVFASTINANGTSATIKASAEAKEFNIKEYAYLL